MKLAELKKLKNVSVELVANVNGKNLGLRIFRHYRQRDNSLVFDIPDGGLSYASLDGLRYESTENGFRITSQDGNRLLAEYVLKSEEEG